MQYVQNIQMSVLVTCYLKLTKLVAYPNDGENLSQVFKSDY